MLGGQPTKIESGNIDRIEKCKSLILTRQQSSEHPYHKGELGRFHIFEIKRENKQIVFFGSKHVSDPDDEMFRMIETKFQEMKPDLVLIEGVDLANNEDGKAKLREELSEADRSDVIRKGGEPLFTLKLAMDSGIDFESPTKPLGEEIKYLLKSGFSRRDTFIYYISRSVYGYQRENTNGNIDDCRLHLERYVRRFLRESGWDQFELRSYADEFLSDLDLSDDRYKRAVNPGLARGRTITNEIADQSSNFRNRSILERIAEGLEKHNKLFIVYGSGHAVVLEPALRELMAQF